MVDVYYYEIYRIMHNCLIFNNFFEIMTDKEKNWLFLPLLSWKSVISLIQ